MVDHVSLLVSFALVTVVLVRRGLLPAGARPDARLAAALGRPARAGRAAQAASPGRVE
jgi:hypothetical protein